MTVLAKMSQSLEIIITLYDSVNYFVDLLKHVLVMYCKLSFDMTLTMLEINTIIQRMNTSPAQ